MASGTDLCKGAETDTGVGIRKRARAARLHPRIGPDMPEHNALDTHSPEFERFLYASVGDDRNGFAVTVLSTLARRGLDPWRETAALADLGRDAAGRKLGLVLSRFKDVPSLMGDHERVARELSLLLPEHSLARGLEGPARPIIAGRLGGSGAIWAVLAILFVLLQLLGVGVPGSGK